jgi:hypothetical protein
MLAAGVSNGHRKAEWREVQRGELIGSTRMLLALVA